jgi:subtilisin family serine protease/subtilisin-like proprotein convertase family protein
LEALAERITPAGVRLDFLHGPIEPARLPGDLRQAHTNTEVIAALRTSDALGTVAVLAATSAGRTLLDPRNSSVLFTHEQTTLVQVGLQPGAAPQAAIELLAALQDTAWAAPNTRPVGPDPREFTPNDPQVGDQYHHSKMNNLAAWEVQTGSANVVIAVTDDGVGYNHPDLAASIWTNIDEIANNGIDDDANGQIDDVRGWDFSSNDKDPLPVGSDSHGTHVAGIFAARTDNNVGVAGVGGGGNGKGTGLTVMPVRWAGSASWTAAVIAKAYAYAADNGAKIVNASYNFDGFANDPTVLAAFDYGYSKGVLFVNSAGNNSQLNPARRVFDHPLFVASTTQTDERSGFSNYGQFVDVAAPGTGILSTTTANNGTTVNYEVYDGTSMSTPNAVGVLGLVWSQNPTWTREQVVAQVLGTADNLDTVPGNATVATWLGSGRVNSFRAVTETLAAPKFGGVTGLPAAGSQFVEPFSTFAIDAPLRFAANALTVGAFELRNAGADNLFNTADDKLVPLTINGGATAYRVGTDGFNFTLGQTLTNGTYRFTAFASKLTDPFGQPLDGDGNGTGGDNFTRTFTIGYQVSGYAYQDWNGDGVRTVGEPGLAGTTMFVDTNGNGSYDTGNHISYPASANLPLTLVDPGLAKATLTISGFTGTIADLNVKLSINHTWAEDLDVFLVAPSGKQVELFTDVGSSADNFIDTVLDDAATVAIATSAAPFTGTFRPEGKLADFNGLDANGVWTLQITDDVASDTGDLIAWALDISNVPPEPTTLAASDGFYFINNLPTGTHSVRRVIPPGFSGTGPSSHVANLTTPTTTVADLHFGHVPTGPNILGRVFEDANGNGLLNAPEVGRAGVTVFVDANGNGTFDNTTTPFPASAGLPLLIEDNKTQSANLTISGFTGALTDVNVKLSITHTYDADLDVYLLAPSGQKVELFTDVGGDGNNFTNTVLDDAATTAITVGTAPFTGTFRPEGKLADFNGVNANGVWTLQIIDDAGGDVGSLTAWSLALTTSETAAVTDAAGNYRLPVTAGTQVVRVAPPITGSATTPAGGSYSVPVTTDPVLNRNFGFDATAPTVGPVQIGGGTVTHPNQRSMVAALTLTFSEVIAFVGTPAAAFTVTRTGPGAPSAFTPTVVLDNSTGVGVVTLTFPGQTGGSLPDGNYTVTVNASQTKDAAGNVQTTANTQTFFRLFGDADGNRQVDFPDFAVFRTALGSTTGAANFIPFFDVETNGQISNTDLFQFRQRLGTQLP